MILKSSEQGRGDTVIAVGLVLVAVTMLGSGGCETGGSSGANRSDGGAIGHAAGSEIGARAGGGRSGWFGSQVGSILGRRSGEAVGAKMDAEGQPAAAETAGSN